MRAPSPQRALIGVLVVLIGLVLFGIPGLRELLGAGSAPLGAFLVLAISAAAGVLGAVFFSQELARSRWQGTLMAYRTRYGDSYRAGSEAMEGLSSWSAVRQGLRLSLHAPPSHFLAVFVRSLHQRWLFFDPQRSEAGRQKATVAVGVPCLGVDLGQIGFVARTDAPAEVRRPHRFEDAVHMSGHEADVAVCSGHSARQVIRRFVGAGGSYEAGVFSLQVDLSARDLEEGVCTLVHVVESLRREGGRDTLLAENLATERDPEVRAQCLAMLWIHHPESRELPGVVSSITGRQFAGNALAARDEQELITSSRDAASQEHRLVSIIQLGLMGTSAALPALADLKAGVPEGGLVWRSADASREAIRSRIGRVEGGHLSLVRAAGGLSQAEMQRKQVGV